jgi:predicted ribosomally synthesized peptide with nif11-like leader
MTVEQAKAFIEKLNNDETFRGQIAQASDDAARLKMAHEAGYEFTVAEFNETIAELAGAADEELSEEQLEAVAGGAMQIFVKTWKDSGPSNNLKWENIVLK